MLGLVRLRKLCAVLPHGFSGICSVGQLDGGVDGHLLGPFKGGVLRGVREAIDGWGEGMIDRACSREHDDRVMCGYPPLLTAPVPFPIHTS